MKSFILSTSTSLAKSTPSCGYSLDINSCIICPCSYRSCIWFSLFLTWFNSCNVFLNLLDSETVLHLLKAVVWPLFISLF